MDILEDQSIYLEVLVLNAKLFLYVSLLTVSICRFFYCYLYTDKLLDELKDKSADNVPLDKDTERHEPPIPQEPNVFKVAKLCIV